MKKLFKFHFFVFLIISGITILSSCTEEPYLEKRTGPWKVTKVEQFFYDSNSSTQADSVVIYESDTLGYFIFYNSNLPKVYILINFHSLFLQSNYYTEYEVHPNNNEILTFINLNSSDNSFHYIPYTVLHPNRKVQQWTYLGNRGFSSAGFMRETIWVEKQD